MEFEKMSLEELEKYMMPELDLLCKELENSGIIFECQCPKICSNVCKRYCEKLIELFTRGTELEIESGYDNKKTFCFVFYDRDRFSREQALIELRKSCP